MSKTRKHSSGTLQGKRLAVIGCGNMGSAIIRGLAARGVVDVRDIIACDRSEPRLEALANDIGVAVQADARQAVHDVDIVVIAVKPKSVATILQSFIPERSERLKLVVSVAAGVSLSQLRSSAPAGVRLARAMPNLAVMTGNGVSGIFVESPEDAPLVDTLFSAVGLAVFVETEDHLDIITALGASAPAFMFIVAEALADGAVKMGLPRGTANAVAAQMMSGAASVLLDTHEHPARLKDMVASPAGSTISGLHVLEDRAVRGAFIAAIEASTLRARAQLVKEERPEARKRN